jgi:lactate 2-monooxygenase
MAEPSSTPKRQLEIYVNGARGVRPRVPVDPLRLEKEAHRALSPKALAYIAGGAGMESTMRGNREAFEKWRIVQRVLRDVSVRDPAIDVFGKKWPSPFYLSPVGVLELMHRDADLAVARAAAARGIMMIFSNQASVPMEPCAKVMGHSPRWFQLYWSKDDELVDSFVQRAEGCGCDAIVVTLDTTWLGWRCRDLDEANLPFLSGQGLAQYTSDPVFMRKLRDPLPGAAPARTRVTLGALNTALSQARAVPGGTIGNLASGRSLAAVRRFTATYARPSLTWSDLPSLRARTKMRILLKGIQHPDDAKRAADAGVDGVIVSNHGGRQVDGAIAALDALPGVLDAVGGRIPVFMDSGIRGGADVFKAVALGAKGVGLGRPFAYGLALAGEAGVGEVIDNIAAEFELTMALAGCRSVAEMDGGALMRPA